MVHYLVVVCMHELCCNVCAQELEYVCGQQAAHIACGITETSCCISVINCSLHTSRHCRYLPLQQLILPFYPLFTFLLLSFFSFLLGSIIVSNMQAVVLSAFSSLVSFLFFAGLACGSVVELAVHAVQLFFCLIHVYIIHKLIVQPMSLHSCSIVQRRLTVSTHIRSKDAQDQSQRSSREQKSYWKYYTYTQDCDTHEVTLCNRHDHRFW